MTAVRADQTRMYAEASEAPEAVARQFAENAELMRDLAQRLQINPPRAVVTYARGSSDHAATFAKYVIETRASLVTSSGAPSIASIYGNTPDVRGMLALAISQSGQSPDILESFGQARSGGAFGVALVNAEGSALSDRADVTVPLRAGHEQSVAATKSYIASLSAILHLVAEWSGDGELTEVLASVPNLLRDAWTKDWSPLVDRLVDARGLYVIGRGPGLGVAQEAALKLKETCRIHAEAFSAAEVRHGPMALVGRDFPLLVFRQSDETGEGIDALVRDLLEYGAPVFVAGPSGGSGAWHLPVPKAHELVEPLLQIQSLYRVANALSLKRSLDPDRPSNLKKVTETV